MRIVRLWLGLVVIMAIALTGCSKREDLKLAEIKDRVITVGDFEDAYGKVDPKFLPTAEDETERKKEFLNTMVNRDVMAVKADELGYDKDPAVDQGMEAFKRMTLQVAFLRHEVGDIKVSDADVKKYYDLTGSSVTFKRIMCDRVEQAEEAYQALEDGLDFTTAVAQYSKGEDAKDGGTVITAPFGALLPELEDPVFSLPVGGYTRPILTPQGWVIIQVVNFNKATKSKPDYEDVKERIRTQIMNQRESLAINNYTEKLREKYGVTWSYDSLEIIFNALPPDRPISSPPGRDQEVYPLLYFDAPDLDKPVVSYPGRTITIKDFSDLYDRASFYNRPRREMRLGGIRGFLTLNIMNDISADAVAKSDIENDPEVKKLLNLKRDELMVNIMYEDLINKNTIVTVDRLEDFYDLNKERLRQPERRSFGVVVNGDIDAALRAQSELLEGQPIAAVATNYSTDSATLENRGKTNLVMRGEVPYLDDVGFAMQNVGDVSEPFQSQNGWVVLKLLEIAPERIFSFEEAREQINAAIKAQDNDKRLDALLEKWSEEYSVVIHEDNLKKVRLPVRPEDAQKAFKEKKDREAQEKKADVSKG